MMNDEKKVPEMVTINECAQRCGLSYGIIRRWCLKGMIPIVKCGRKTLINWPGFLRFLDGETGTEGNHAG